MKNFLDELDERTGWRKVKETLLDRKIPKGVDWRYTLGSMAGFLFLMQAVTGMLLAMHYSPSQDHAYDSIRFIMDVVPMGAFLRGLHKWGASAMVVVVVLHMIRVYFMAAYKYPREATWLTGIGLLLVVIGLGFTGYLLPWDQKAYWATVVGSHISEQTPIIGAYVGKILKGGDELGAITLTRFYAIHMLLLPMTILGLMGLHLFLVVWHGISAPPEKIKSFDPAGPDWKEKIHHRYLEMKEKGKSFFPYVVFKDTFAIALLLAVIAGLALWKGAELEGLADPTDTSYNPRPEWYFLFIFQGLKYFPGSLEAIATILLPGLGVTALLALPFLDRSFRRHPFDRPILSTVGLAAILGIGFLTIQGLRSPLTNPILARNPLVMEGKRLYGDLKCQYCHTLDGKGGHIGPVLDEVGSRRDAAWLTAHFRNPQQVTKGTVMPNFNLLDNEVQALVAYMSTLGGGSYSPKAPPLFEERCMVCHKLHGKGEEIGPDLSSIGQYRDAPWIQNYVTNPPKVNKDSAMPPFEGDLTPAQIEDLSHYLASQRAGAAPKASAKPVKASSKKK